MPLTLGRVRGLSQLADARGMFAILACDQRGSIVRMLRDAQRPADYAAVVQAKLDIVGALAPLASGVLLDPLYGAGQCIAHGALPGRTGLVVAVESSGYDAEDEDRLAGLLDGWSVGQAKALGASAVKLLVYFNPRRERAAAHQIALIERVIADCRRVDLPLMLEPLVFPTRPDAGETAFLAEREELIVESAKVLSQLDIDLYKAEFPIHPKLDADERRWQASCERLSAACRTPWALLSAGVAFDLFVRQLQIALRAGASGFIAGRAIWKEAVTTADDAARHAFVHGEMVARLRRLVALTETAGRPWHDVPSRRTPPETLVGDGWYARYPGLRA